MIDYERINNVIVEGLHNHIGQLVILADQEGKKPQYPYVTVKATSPYIPQSAPAIEIGKVVPSENPNFDYDYEYTRIEQPTMSFSVTSHSNDQDEALKLSLSCRSWLEFYGYDILKANHLVVQELTSVQNRDMLLVNHYERRYGFDIILRTVSKIKRRIETIEEIIILRGE